MAINPYDTCPCGSGKKFKFCCTSYYDYIQKALNQMHGGQHEGSVRTVREMLEKHPNRSVVWGYAAQILYNEGQKDEAEKALDKAIELDAQLPMAYFLRGLFRQNEGKFSEAHTLFRKAADLYNPEAKEQLSYVYEVIARNEFNENRPVAAHAALEQSLSNSPADIELRQYYNTIFGSESTMPRVARKKYSLRPTLRPLPQLADTGKLSDVQKAYQQLTTDAPNDPAGWFNLGLSNAWLGNSAEAVEALNKSIDLEIDDSRAEEASALVELMKIAVNMQDETDYPVYLSLYQIRDGKTVSQFIDVLLKESRLLAPNIDERNFFTARICEQIPGLIDTETQMFRSLCSIEIGSGLLKIFGTNQKHVEKIGVELRDRVNLAVSIIEPGMTKVSPKFSDVTQEAIIYPKTVIDPKIAEEKLRNYAAQHYEEKWINTSLKSLNGATPIDAAGSKLMRKRLLGIIRFHEDCLEATKPMRKQNDEVSSIEVYDFTRLRHKLGLDSASPLQHSASTGQKLDFSNMNAADLATVSIAELGVADLAEGMRAAMKLDARELAVAYARSAVSRPVDPSYTDRFPFYLALVNAMVANGETEAAVKLLAEGAAHDGLHNNGKRSADFGRQKGKIYARSGDIAAATTAYNAVIDASPDEPRNYIDAAETMLRAKDKTSAATFAERGIEKAQRLGNRDLEGACREILAAAKK
jgi:tetratricopeptide (TPR) repeat protein